MPHTWDPDRYLTYADERGRPFVELVARVGADRPGHRRRPRLRPRQPDHPAARALARGRPPRPRLQPRDDREGPRPPTPPIDFDVADLRDWSREAEPVDVLVSNATLQWVPGHLDLLPRAGRAGSGRAAGSRSRCPATSTSPATRSAPSSPPRRRTPTTPAASRSPAATTRPSTSRRWPRSAAASTPGRRRTSTSSPAPTRSSPGSPAPAPARPSRRCPTTCGRASRRSSGAASRAAYPERDGRVVLPFRRVFVVARQARPTGPARPTARPHDRAAPRAGRLPAGRRGRRAPLLRRRARA